MGDSPNSSPTPSQLNEPSTPQPIATPSPVSNAPLAHQMPPATLPAGLWQKLLTIGTLPEDSPDERTRKTVLTLLALLSIVIGTILALFDTLTGFHYGAVIPFLYVIASSIGLVHFSYRRNVRVVRFLVLGGLLICPFGAMWLRGGFANSGASMIWALGAPVFGVMFHGIGRSIRWFAAYLVLLVISVLIDPSCARFAQQHGISPSSWYFLAHIGGISFCLFILIQFFVQRLGEEQAKSESLLLNILPRQVAGRLKHSTSTIADGFQEATILFADLAGFTRLSSTLAPDQVVHLLNEVFSAFDRLAEKHGLEKVKTIGDAYMVVGGIPEPRADHPHAVARMALEMRETVSDLNRQHGWSLRIRIGMNTGPVVAGVIGLKKFIYDLWGDAVNIASRMESTGIENEIQVTRSTFERLNPEFVLEPRGHVQVKGKGEMETWLLKGVSIKAQT